MRLDDYIEELEPDEEAERRRLAKEKSYAITDHLEDFERNFEQSLSGDTLVGSTAPSIFVGRSNYPDIPIGLLSPVGDEEQAEEYVTDGKWYQQGYAIDDVLQRRTGLLNSSKPANVDSPSIASRLAPSVDDVWDGFVGVQREVAISDRPVDLEIGLDDTPDLGLDAGTDVATPRGPRANAKNADLRENPHVPKAVKKTLEDDDWQAQGAMTYLYRRGFDVYEINSILSAGALGETKQRRLVPTRWSITAVDDTVGQFVRGQIRTNPSINEVQVWANEYMGNRYWIILSPGRWEFELVEMKAPGSIWNPNPHDAVWMASASEGYEGRTGYVEETAGAYYAARLGVLEHLESIGRQAKCLVLREVSDDYWAPVGVWQVRESVRNAFDGAPGDAGDQGLDGRESIAGEYGEAETFHDAVAKVSRRLPVSHQRLRRKSELAAGLQSSLDAFSSGSLTR
ncbi:Nre family DNA repair protein [Halostagnicola sp. A-GB9-2]|uniref:Nre family DNA repair protein n=1 Tax=Halostagnicola sp. A-GB9-2 TaxID=3048066 RepID=UPI0024C0A778|nr:Nre family DNA repair protein [Halostagnicola sp. A-GB9-2]MDJ1431771.1 Nre family DNA repair protein [Halostagnicola sp. A-GB9-2]